MRGVALAVVCATRAVAADPAPFAWPDGKVAAISLSWDDARTSQIDVGLPVLDRFGVKATFFVLPPGVEARAAGWKRAVHTGHEIGNHTLVHPCTGNLDFSAANALEDYTLDKLAAELTASNQRIRELLGVTPETFAYPCGNTFVGRGVDVRSYVPVVAARFVAARLWKSEGANNPRTGDLAQVQAIELDGKTFDEIMPLLDDARRSGKWLVFAGHEIGPGGAQTTRVHTLEQLLGYVNDPRHGFWVAPIGTVAKYIRSTKDSLP